MSGKTPSRESAKKQGRTIKEKRAEKREKAVLENETVPKRRKR